MEFTPQFQREMVVLLLQDTEAYGRYFDIWKPEYFDDVHHRKISEAFIKVRVSAKEHPTKTSIIQELLGDLEDVRNLPMDKEEQLKELEILYAAKPQNKNYTIEKVRRAAHNESIKVALGAAIEHIHNEDPIKAFDVLTQANRVGSAKEEELENVVNELAVAQIDESPNILGNRLLERGTFGVIIGHSGVGKSTLTVQAGIELAAGHPLLGITPARPLKVLVVQAEGSKNDRIDQVRCLQVLVPDEEERKEMSDRLWMYSTTLRGEELFTKLRELNNHQKVPFDLFILNPAFAFLQDGAAAEESKDVSHFLRKLWLPFLQETDSAGLIMHHPPKLNNRDTSKWTVCHVPVRGSRQCRMDERSPILYEH
jgi:DNA replication protein DnaC